jgi:hypothetical protein
MKSPSQKKPMPLIVSIERKSATSHLEQFFLDNSMSLALIFLRLSGL